MKSCFVLSITKSGTQPSHSSLRVLQPPLPPSSQPSPFSLQPPSPSPLDHITLFLLMTSEHLQHFLSFPPSPYSSISLILSQIHPLVFPPLPPQLDQPPFSCMIPSLISRLQSQTLLSILIINHIWTINQDDHSSWRDE